MTSHCCETMRRQIEHHCDDHADAYDCPDAVVAFSTRFQEYGLIIHDGGRSSFGIAFCPWCGSRLPESQRDRWFEELERLGLDPWEDEVPPAYEDDRWLTGAGPSVGPAAD
ncbi:hypothetical protein [Streptomyces sp. CC208A]|uniref:DUF6980 family protein n=1 Tax=Streptomyces sp. CC208A TaxID=3044573 RepID=UPI0024A8964F|nr:hypothetical protein [Streptomyces sp. CC208A]